uniref:Uncharacterized protein n=1 Tax=Octopus bimaculoides TaxID=37653 RepID=A0A0L8G1Y9_OCTBM
MKTLYFTVILICPNILYKYLNYHQASTSFLILHQFQLTFDLLISPLFPQSKSNITWQIIIQASYIYFMNYITNNEATTG